MTVLPNQNGLYTDFYELTMAQGYFLEGREQQQGGFDYFFRKLPFQGGYVIFAGLSDLLEILRHLHFDDEALQYLQQQGFHADFLDYLQEFRFTGDIHAVREGEIVFPFAPILKARGNIIEVQIIETVVLNVLNFESLIATKAARIRRSAGNRLVVDFGLRRAQGLGGIHASKAAVIGGADSTSNVYSACRFGLKTAGTQAHSWIESYPDEITAFRAFARYFPDNCILLVDTYDTLRSGIPNAITVAKEMGQTGHRLLGVRLDSGDLAYLSKKARAMLDEAGLEYVKIMSSNQLDEYVIKSLLEQGAPIDGFGVGTRLVTGRDDASMDGVYKLCEYESEPRLKMSENIEKIVLPGNKKVLRIYNGAGQFYADAILLQDEEHPDLIHHPHFPDKQTNVAELISEEILHPVMKHGAYLAPPAPVEEIAAYAKKRLQRLPEEHKRFENPHIYKVGISTRLQELRKSRVRELQEKFLGAGP